MLNYLCFETMAEATISAAQVRKRIDRSFLGYDDYLEQRFRAVLPHCLKNNTKIISNQGWVNPIGAAKAVKNILREIDRSDVKVAAVSDSVFSNYADVLTGMVTETGESIDKFKDEVVSVEVYWGADPIVEALSNRADIVITGRVADTSLFLGPMIYEFDWAPTDINQIGQGSGLGHLLECGAQVTGGYFIDPGFKDFGEPWNLGFPIAEVEPDGTAVISKLLGTGGGINRHTVLEQMFYEVHDPERYITPDCVVNFTTAVIDDLGNDNVRVSNIKGGAKTATLKVLIGVLEGFLGQDTFYFAGVGCLEKAKLAKRILEERYQILNICSDKVRVDFIGVNSIHGACSPEPLVEPYEIGVRVAGRSRSLDEVEKIVREVDSMAVSGLASTGKNVPFGNRIREIVGIYSMLVNRSSVKPIIHYF